MTTSAELYVRCWLQARLSPAYEQSPWSQLMRTLIELEGRGRVFEIDDVALLGATLPQLRIHTERAVYQATRIYEQLEQQGRLDARGEVLRRALASEAGTLLDEHWRGPR